MALGNGRLISSATDGGKTTWRWREDSPMATYLATATNGDFDLTTDTGPNGLPIYNAIDSRATRRHDGFSAAQKATAAQRFATQPQIIAVLSDLWGPYPFDERRRGDRHAATSATRSSPRPSRCTTASPSQSTVVHELAHQWFGDSVTLSVWRDIWLAEGFARFSEWMYNERTGGQTAQQQFNSGANYGARRRRQPLAEPAGADPRRPRTCSIRRSCPTTAAR